MSEGSQAVVPNEARHSLTDSLRANAIIAEFHILRDEISLYHEHQRGLINYAILTIVGLVGAIFPIILQGKEEFAFVFLFIPIILAVLGLIYCDRTIRILRIADYIHNHLRKKAAKVVGEKIWQWEVYKRHASPFSKRLALVLDRIRWVIFLVPGILAIILFWLLHGPHQWTPIDWLLFIVSSLCILITLVLSFVVEETTGVATRDIPDLDKLDQG